MTLPAFKKRECPGVVEVFQVGMTRRRHEQKKDESTKYNQVKPTQMPKKGKVTYDMKEGNKKKPKKISKKDFLHDKRRCMKK